MLNAEHEIGLRDLHLRWGRLNQRSRRVVGQPRGLDRASKRRHTDQRIGEGCVQPRKPDLATDQWFCADHL